MPVYFAIIGGSIAAVVAFGYLAIDSEGVGERKLFGVLAGFAFCVLAIAFGALTLMIHVLNNFPAQK